MTEPIDFVDALIKLKEHFPTMFESPTNIEALKIRFQTELAMQEQKIKLFEKQHEWELQKLEAEK